MPQNFVLNAILRELRKLPGYPNLKVLDLSCGEGKLISALLKDGVSASGSHYCDKDYIVRDSGLLAGCKVDAGVDLMKPLPYEGASVDVVAMSEVLEHIPDHIGLIDEVGRILKPGGYFVSTSPNIFRFHSRLRFLLSGKHKLIRRRAGWDLKKGDLYAYHINPVDFPLFHTLVRLAGMRVERLGITRIKWYRIEWILLYPLILLSNWWNIDSGPQNPAEFERGEKDLFKFMISPSLLASEQLLIVTRKD